MSIQKFNRKSKEQATCDCRVQIKARCKNFFNYIILWIVLLFSEQSPSSTRAFILSLIVMAIMVLMGNMPLQVYAENVFREAAPSFDANKCSIWLAVDFVAATVMCSLVVDRLGRKVSAWFLSRIKTSVIAGVYLVTTCFVDYINKICH